MREVILECCHGILEHSCVMGRPRPSHKEKYKNHVKVASSHHILSCDALATQVLHKLILWHQNREVTVIYSSYAPLEFRIEPSVPHPMMHYTKFWVHRFNDIIPKCNNTGHHSIEHVMHCA
jgi:hypothetical protein